MIQLTAVVSGIKEEGACLAMVHSCNDVAALAAKLRESADELEEFYGAAKETEGVTEAERALINDVAERVKIAAMQGRQVNLSDKAEGVRKAALKLPEGQRGKLYRAALADTRRQALLSVLEGLRA